MNQPTVHTNTDAPAAPAAPAAPLEVHPLAELFPLMAPDDLADLAADIRANGLREPVVLFEGMILDGRNRLSACVAAGVKPLFCEFSGDQEAARRAVYSWNLHRRHLSRDQKRDVITRLLADNPARSNRQIAEEVHADHHTVAAVRDNLEARGEIPHLTTAMGSDGKVYPSTRAAEPCGEPPNVEMQAEAEQPPATSSGAPALGTPPMYNTPDPSTRTDEWYTPPEYLEAARRAMGSIDLDPASCEVAQRTVQAATFYTQDQDGLQQPWHGNIWLNPPYGSAAITAFTNKLEAELAAGNVLQAVILVNAYTETRWFQRLSDLATAVLFAQKRVHFLKADGTPGDSSPHAQAVFYLGERPERFRAAFADLCWWPRCPTCEGVEGVEGPQEEDAP